jgi:hypothetical protein
MSLVCPTPNPGQWPTVASNRSAEKFQLNRACLRFARARAYIGGMGDVTYWTGKLR